MPPDIGDNIPVKPALSATSDTPVIEAPPSPVDPPPDPPAAEGDDQSAAPPAAPADDAEQRPEGEPGDQPAPKERQGRSMGDRLSTMAAQRRAAEQRADKLADMLERALGALEARQQQPQNPQSQERPPVEAPVARPAREDYADPDAYDLALIEWSAQTATRVATAEADRRAAEARAAEERARTEQTQQAEAERIQTAWNERRTKLMEQPDYQDWEDVAMNPDLEISMSMVPAILHADNGPQVMYHLGKNPAEASRIAKLDPMSQVLEIGKLSARIAEPARPPVRRLTPPIEPVGTRNNAGTKTPDEETMDEYAARRQRELAGSQNRAGVFGRA